MHYLRLLGGAILEEESGPVSGRAARRHPMALLALLATVPGHSLSRGKLVGYLWPDVADKVSRNRLSTAVHVVREALGKDVLVSAGSDLRLNTQELGCDVWEFEQALEAGDPERAADLYGGPFLDGFHLPDSPSFDKWTDRERDRLRAAYLEALEELAERAEDRNEPQEAVKWWRRRAGEDPYDSRAVRRLMEALAAAGNRAEALRAARVHVRLVEEELGMEPSAELTELAARLKRGEGPSRSAVAAQPGPAESARAEPDPDGATVWTEEKPEAPADEAEGEAPTPAGDAVREGRFVRRVVLGVVAAGLAVAATMGGIHLLGAGGEPGAAASVDGSIAVLPFEAPGDSEVGMIAAGMHADLLARLANVPELEVIAETSVERYRNSPKDRAEVARELGVRWVLEGRVEEADGEIRVNAHLVDPRTDRYVWGSSYRRELTAANLFDLQGEITQEIARALEAELTPEEARYVGRRPTEDLEAYRLYVQGRSQLDRRTEAGTARAVELFRRALERDSSYALAWVGWADAVSLRREYGYPSLPDSLAVDPARAVERALAVDSTLAEAHASRSLLTTGVEAVEALRRAVELKPSYARAHHWLGNELAVIGRLEESIRSLERAAELDPFSPSIHGALASPYYWSGRPEEALREVRRAAELSPELALFSVLEGIVLSALGRQPEARASLRTGLEALPDSQPDAAVFRAWRAVIEVRAGDTARAREVLATLGPEPKQAFARGVALAALGEEDEALEAFRGADLAGRWKWAGWFRYEPVLEPLRSRPAYRELLRHLNVELGLDPDGSLPGDAASSG